ncbi:MAG: hypothetical protein LUO89_04315 [Methanothrix sp.]|nr:hypothetical protein [Methanothrix sp.]
MSKRRIILVLAVSVVLIAVGGYVVFCSAARRRAESLTCASAVTSICLAAHVWANDHGGLMPTNFMCMKEEISAPKILSCVQARRARTENWADFTPENCTYEILAPGMRVDDTNTAFLRCTIHGHLGYSDTTVFDGVRRRHKFD